MGMGDAGRGRKWAWEGNGGVALCHQRRDVGQLFDLIQQTVGRQWGFVCSSCTAQTDKEREKAIE